MLAGVGICSVMAYLVSRRVKEIGIRTALGASPRAVLRDVVLAGLRLVLLGMTIGFSLAAVIACLSQTSLAAPSSADLFYGVPFYDPATFLNGRFLTAVAGGPDGSGVQSLGHRAK